MRKLILILAFGFMGMTLNAQDSTNQTFEENNKLISIGFITGFYAQVIETWSVGMSLSGTFQHNVGFYIDGKYASFEEEEEGQHFETISTSYIWHLGLSIAVNRLFRPYIAFGLKHDKYSYGGNPYTPLEQSLNVAIGFNIGSKKSIVGFQGGVELDSKQSDFSINGVAGITINFW